MQKKQQLSNFLANIRIVMVNTTLPANIGSTARAMFTMGLTDLVVVSPKRPIDDDAYAHASGAGEVLKNAKIVENIHDAIADCHYILATSSRQRHIPKPVMTPRQITEMLVTQYSQKNENLPKIALLFGREDRGLTNDELQLADYHIQIPANPDYPILNVASAVQVITSVLYDVAEQQFSEQISANNQSKILDITVRQQWDEPPISHEQQQQIEQKFLNLLQQIDIYHPQQAKHLPERVSRLFGRMQLDNKEYQLLQAMFAKISQKLL